MSAHPVPWGAFRFGLYCVWIGALAFIARHWHVGLWPVCLIAAVTLLYGACYAAFSEEAEARRAAKRRRGYQPNVPPADWRIVRPPAGTAARTPQERQP